MKVHEPGPGDPYSPRPGRAPGYLRGQSARSRRGRGRAEAVAQGPARLASARGSVPLGRRTRIPARPPRPAPQENGAKRRLLPNNSAVHRRNNASVGPGSGAPGSRGARRGSALLLRASPGSRRARPGLAAASPNPTPRPRQARAGRPGDSGPGPARRPPPTSPPAHPPFRPAAARASPGACARPPRPQSLRHRGSGPACAAAATAARPLRPPTLTRVSGCPQGSGDVSARSLGPGPVKPRPAKVWLRPSAARAAPPGAACDTAPASASSPARPPALLPPLPPPPPAPRNLRPLAFPARLPALPASPAPATAGRSRGGGPGRTAIGAWGGGAGKPPPPSPRSPEAREGPGNLPPARRGRRPGRPSAAAPLAGCCLPASRGPCPGAQPSARRAGSAAGFCSRPRRGAASGGRFPPLRTSEGLTLGGGLRRLERLPEGEGLPPPCAHTARAGTGRSCTRRQTPAQIRKPESCRVTETGSRGGSDSAQSWTYTPTVLPRRLCCCR
ncbi:basic proline-rich protein-like [Sciurus carolinensis]|uniref:basic proline-rich protein-like n=1 Tax=Sciurus carolinensis TaxID=30640 RepID=UPI001FB4315D|nr:basic proline-rich protein-like [Sciurus carolinensis]